MTWFNNYLLNQFNRKVMKIFYVLLLLNVCFVTAIFAQSNEYDSALAKKLHADEYGMKNYI